MSTVWNRSDRQLASRPLGPCKTTPQAADSMLLEPWQMVSLTRGQPPCYFQCLVEMRLARPPTQPAGPFSLLNDVTYPLRQ
jgi:hypothetical protein